MLKPRILLPVAAVLLIAQAVVIWMYHSHSLAARLSDILQLSIGILCLVASIRAVQRSTKARRDFWLSLSAMWGLWALAQGLGIYFDLISLHTLDALVNLLFFTSGIPVAMVLFLDTNHGSDRFDRLHLLDFVQVCGFWLCVYLYFKGQAVTAVTTVGSTPLGWSTSLVFDGVLALSFALRALLTRSREVRTLFVPMAVYLLAAGLSDSYAGFDANHVESGSWFDLVWTFLLLAPLLIGLLWKDAEHSVTAPETRAQRIIVNQFFPLVYPFCALLLINQIAEGERLLASGITAVIFAAVAVRVLMIQRRLVEAQETLCFEATHDSLTGLLNRSEILQRLHIELDRQKRTGEPMGLIMVDADHFKRINDTYGHVVGDEVLRELGHRLMTSIRSYDSVGRYGGEEFLIVVPSCDGKDALVSAMRLRHNIEEPPILTSAGSIPVTVSAGLITTTGFAGDVDCTMLLRVADEALYRAKASGRNRVESAIFWGAGPKEAPEACSPRSGAILDVRPVS